MALTSFDLKISIWIFALLFSLALAPPTWALTDLDCYLKPGCRAAGQSRSSSPSPSTGGRISINPSDVPTEQGFGIEGILFKDEVDLSLVRGLGRVGAAISPSNSEETFFGPPGFELPENLLQRKKDAKKYPSQKITVATAFSLLDRKGSGIKSYNLKLGLMGKYNEKTKDVTPGAGLSGSIGPFTGGVSIYNDVTQLDYSVYGSALTPPIKYQVQTYNIGIFLTSLTLDYSNLRIQTTDPSTVHLYTASLTHKKFIFTASKRIEESLRPSYDFETQDLESKKSKEETFGGVQFWATQNFMVGVLYNYYLLREFSVTATLFF